MIKFRDIIDAEDRIVALENCFHTWDGSEVTLESMVAGIHDRLRFLGLSGKIDTEIKRRSIREVSMTVNLGSEYLLVYSKKDEGLHDCSSAGFRLSRFFNDSEMEIMQKTLLTFYHKKGI